MLNETASSAYDRPALRSTVGYEPEESALQIELRRLVTSVLSIERENFDTLDERLSREGMLMLGANARYVATYEGRLLLGSEAAYAQLDDALRAQGYLPLFRPGDNGRDVIHIIAGRTDARPRSWVINLVLFLVTLFSVLIVGTEMALNEIAADNPFAARQLAENFFFELWRGLPYALSILLILGAHELGHYFAARHHKIAVTLPYFIPAPFISLLGTFGAFIQLREPMRNRKVLLDVGAAGPLAGLVFAIPILFIGLATSQTGPITPGGVVEGNSFLYALAKTLVFGQFLPNGEIDVYVNQLAWAGWTGLLVTGLNLIPIGQLDGGHILYSLIGSRARWLYFPLLGAMVLLVFVTDTWLFWLILLFLFGRVYATPLDTITPLDTRRRWIGILSMIVFVVTFVPIPLSPVPDVVQMLPRDSAMLPFAVGLLALFTMRRR